MPFDAANYADNEVSAAGVEVGKLRRLSEALKGEMPGWRWDFRTTTDRCFAPECGTAGCALGLAGKMGLLSELPDAFDIGQGTVSAFGLTMAETFQTFGDNSGYGVLTMGRVRPRMVAAAIDRIIARETA